MTAFLRHRNETPTPWPTLISIYGNLSLSLQLMLPIALSNLYLFPTVPQSHHVPLEHRRQFVGSSKKHLYKFWAIWHCSILLNLYGVIRSLICTSLEPRTFGINITLESNRVDFVYKPFYQTVVQNTDRSNIKAKPWTAVWAKLGNASKSSSQGRKRYCPLPPFHGRFVPILPLVLASLILNW